MHQNAGLSTKTVSLSATPRLMKPWNSPYGRKTSHHFPTHSFSYWRTAKRINRLLSLSFPIASGSHGLGGQEIGVIGGVLFYYVRRCCRWVDLFLTFISAQQAEPGPFVVRLLTGHRYWGIRLTIYPALLIMIINHPRELYNFFWPSTHVG